MGWMNAIFSEKKKWVRLSWINFGYRRTSETPDPNAQKKF